MDAPFSGFSMPTRALFTSIADPADRLMAGWWVFHPRENNEYNLWRQRSTATGRSHLFLPNNLQL